MFDLRRSLLEIEVLVVAARDQAGSYGYDPWVEQLARIRELVRSLTKEVFAAEDDA